MLRITQLQGFIARILLATSAASVCQAETQFSLGGTVWEQAASRYGVEKELLYAIALAESKRNAGNVVRPWPWVLNIAGKGYFYDTRSEAEDALHQALSAGIESIDVGLMQVNLRWNGHRVENPSDLFDITTSAMVGAEILSEAVSSSPTDRVLGVGRYHNWDDDVARAYGNQVLKFRNVVVQAQGARH